MRSIDDGVMPGSLYEGPGMPVLPGDICIAGCGGGGGRSLGGVLIINKKLSSVAGVWVCSVPGVRVECALASSDSASPRNTSEPIAQVS
jgi:hypothetical protein